MSTHEEIKVDEVTPEIKEEAPAPEEIAAAVDKAAAAANEGGRDNDLYKALGNIGESIAPVWPQFLLVVLLTMGIGATKKLSFDAQGVMSRTIYAADVTTYSIAQQKFIAFGFAKAIANLLGAIFSDTYGKRPVLMVGWTMGIIHVLMNLGGVWELTVWSNIFLGFQQGICWSLMIFMMVDMAGPANRALAVGLNETAGYTAVAIFGKIGPLIWGDGKTWEEGNDASTGPYYGMLVFMVIGLVTSMTILTDTRPIVQGEQASRFVKDGINEFTEVTKYVFPSGRSKAVSVYRFSFVETSFLNNSLMACCLAGLAINYMTTFAWGLGKSLYKQGGDDWSAIDSDTSTNITLTYDLTKGVLQFLFGFYSDRTDRKTLICAGLTVNCFALLMWGFVGKFATSTDAAINGFYVAAFSLGLGTSMMYAVVIAAVAESADPSWRSSAVGAYRFWRDSGYAIGGLLMGYVADASGIFASIICSAGVMMSVSIIFYFLFEEVVEDPLDMVALNTDFANGTWTDRPGPIMAVPIKSEATIITAEAVDGVAVDLPVGQPRGGCLC